MVGQLVSHFLDRFNISANLNPVLFIERDVALVRNSPHILNHLDKQETLLLESFEYAHIKQRFVQNERLLRLGVRKISEKDRKGYDNRNLNSVQGVNDCSELFKCFRTLCISSLVVICKWFTGADERV